MEEKKERKKQNIYLIKGIQAFMLDLFIKYLPNISINEVFEISVVSILLQ